MNREKLIQRLEFAAKALGSNALFPVYHCFRITSSKVLTSNGAVSILMPLESDGEKLDVTVPAHTFLELLKNTKTKDVSLIQKDDKLLVKGGRLKGKFFSFKRGGALKMPDHSKVKWKEANMDVLKGLVMASFVASQEESAKTLRGVCISGKYVCATDKFRAFRYRVKKPVDFTVVVPPRVSDIISSCMDNVRNWNISDEEIKIQLEDGTVISGLLFEGKYPSISAMFLDPEGVDVKKLVFKEDFTQAAIRHDKFLRELRATDRELIISIEGSACTLISKHETLGQLKETIPLSKKSTVRRPFRFVINPGYVSSVQSSELFYSPERGMVYLRTKQFEYVALTKVTGE